MRYLRSSGFHISSLPAGLKLVLTLYLIANIFGLAVSTAMFSQRLGNTPTSVQQYYEGDETIDAPVIGVEIGGKSAEHITSAAHPHLFTVPLILLVIAHLAHLTNVGQRLLGALDVGAFLGFFMMFGAPFLISSAPSLMSISMMIGAILLTLCMAALCVISLIAMWRVPRKSVPQAVAAAAS